MEFEIKKIKESIREIVGDLSLDELLHNTTLTTAFECIEDLFTNTNETAVG